MPNPQTKATVTDITGYTQCNYNITFNLWCPAPPRFPSEGGCGKLVKQYGVSGDLSDLINDINKWKAIQVRCPYCHYNFVPGEVYI